MLISGKVNMILDGSFGSTGKGLMSAYIAEHNHIDIAIARLSPNAGHTFYVDGKKYISKLIPVSAVIQPKSTIYISAGSVIKTDILFKEMKEFDIDDDRLIIHPRTAVIDDTDLRQESDVLTSIGSTLSGSGSARATKILRTNPLAQGTASLQKYIKPFNLQEYLDIGLTIFVETGQGFELGINSGFSYPYCTSIDITPSAVLSDLGIHPSYMGNLIVTIRTYPIRVGNPTDSQGNVVGTSGSVHEDSIELDWADLNVPPELTTVTGRIRRVFTFSKSQYAYMCKTLKPDYIFLNFINYLREEDLHMFTNGHMVPTPTHVGYGPYTHQIEQWDPYICNNHFHKYR